MLNLIEKYSYCLICCLMSDYYSCLFLVHHLDVLLKQQLEFGL